MRLDWNGGICASAQRRSRQEMCEAAQSWVRVRGAEKQCVLQQVVDTRQEQKGGSVGQSIHPNPIPASKTCRRSANVNQIRSGPTHGPRVTCPRRRFRLFYVLILFFPTMIGTLPVIQPHGWLEKLSGKAVPMCQCSSGGCGGGGGWWWHWWRSADGRV